MNSDLTYILRNCESVSEYIMIGETDDGNCGCPWLSWGNENFRTDKEELEKWDKFERVDLHHLSELQLSRYNSNEAKTSATVSFRRRKQL